MKIIIDAQIAKKIANEIAWRRGPVSIVVTDDGCLHIEGEAGRPARAIGSAVLNAKARLQDSQRLVAALE